MEKSRGKFAGSTLAILKKISESPPGFGGGSSELKYFRIGLAVFSLVFAIVFSMIFVFMPASAAGFVGTNYSGKVIEVMSGGIFVLRTELVWDEAEVPGYYGVTIIWEDNNRADENFTVLCARAFIDDDGDNLPGPSPIWLENTTELLSGTGTNGKRWTFKVYNTTGDDRDGYFDVEIYMQAASRGTPHRAPWDNHPINKAGWGGSIDYAESTVGSTTPVVTTIRVLEAPAGGVDVSVSPSYQSGLPGAVINYIVTVKNTGTLGPDNYNLSKGDNTGWGDNVWLDNYRLENIPQGENRTTTLRVRIPGNATGCTEDNIWVKATSQADNTKSDNESCIAHVTIVRGVQVVIDPPSQENENGGMLAYTVTVKNTGNVQENFQLTKGDNAGWTLALENTWLLTPKSENRATRLTITIPANARGCTWDNIWVKATSKDNAAIFDNKSCLAHVRVVRGVDVSISPSENTGRPCTTLVYTVTVRNVGNVDDNYLLSWSDNAGWGDNIWLSDNWLWVPRGSENTAKLLVHIPTDVRGCTYDNITVTATCKENTLVKDNVSCLAHAAIVRGVEVSISPSYQSGLNGETLDYTVTVSNTGNVEDTYTLTAADNAGWGPTVSPSLLTVPPWSSGTATLSVTVPANAVGCTNDNITVTAAGTGVSDSDSCIAHAIEKVVGWDASITATFSGGSDDAIFGVRPDASSGFDNAYDIPEPPAPPEPYVRAYFYYPGQVPDELHHSCLAPENLMEWPLRIEYADDIENVTLTWNIENVPTEYNVLLYRGADLLADMRVEDNYTFEASTGTYDFRIVVGAIVRGVQVVITPPSQENENGGTLTYIVTVINTGIVQENFHLTKGDNAGWALTLENTWLLVPNGENRATKLTVNIPANAAGCTWDNIWVKATSQDDAAVFDNKSCLAHVRVVRSVDISISPSYQSGLPGATLNYTVTVSNTGNVEDTYSLTAADNTGWAPTVFPGLLIVPPWENRTATLSVTVPMSAIGCTNDNITVTATGTGVSDSDSCVAHASVVRGVQVVIAPPTQENENGDTLKYDVFVKNLGNVQENFQLTRGDNAGWTLALDNTWLLVPNGENRTTKLTVTIPTNATGCTWDNIWVRATSKDNENVWDNESCLAHVKIVRGVQVVITPPSQENENGGTLTYTVTVTNLGNVPENFQLEKGDNAGWALTLENTWLLTPKGENRTTKLIVNIPANAAGCTWDNIWVKATSKENAEVFDNKSCLAHVRVVEIVRGVQVVIEPSYRSGVQGSALSYTVTITNTGNVMDNYDLTVSDNENWGPTLDNNRFENVAPGEDKATILRVTIPENAVPCTRDNITVMAIGTGVSANDSCIAHATIVIGVPKVSIYIIPSYKSGKPCTTLTYMLIVWNRGNVIDNYALSVSDNAGWAPTLSSYLLENVKPGRVRVVILSVHVPEGATHCTRDNITVVVSSQADPSVSSSASCIAHAFVPLREVSIQIIPSYKSGEPGTTLNYMVIVWNRGDVVENYALSVSDNAGWAPTLSSYLLENVKPGRVRVVTLSVHVPEGATHCTRDIITVVVSSQADPSISSSASCIAHAFVPLRKVSIQIFPSYKSGSPCTTLTYTVMIWNKGNVVDNYALSVSDNAGWAPTLSSYLLENVKPCEFRFITLSVHVPEGATYCTKDIITVVVSSQADTAIENKFSCIAHVAAIPHPSP